MIGYAAVYFVWVTLLAACVWQREPPVVQASDRHLHVWHYGGVCYLHPDTAPSWRSAYQKLSILTLVGGYGLGALLLGLL